MNPRIGSTKDLRFDEAVRELELGSNTKRKTTGAREKRWFGDNPKIQIGVSSNVAK